MLSSTAIVPDALIAVTAPVASTAVTRTVQSFAGVAPPKLSPVTTNVSPTV